MGEGKKGKGSGDNVATPIIPTTETVAPVETTETTVTTEVIDLMGVKSQITEIVETSTDAEGLADADTNGKGAPPTIPIAMSDGSLFVFTPEGEQPEEGAAIGTVKYADGADVEPGIYAAEDGLNTEVTVQDDGIAIARDTSFIPPVSTTPPTPTESVSGSVTYEVIKAYGVVKVGDVRKKNPRSENTQRMITLGYWQEVK